MANIAIDFSFKVKYVEVVNRTWPVDSERVETSLEQNKFSTPYYLDCLRINTAVNMFDI